MVLLLVHCSALHSQYVASRCVWATFQYPAALAVLPQGSHLQDQIKRSFSYYGSFPYFIKLNKINLSNLFWIFNKANVIHQTYASYLS